MSLIDQYGGRIGRIARNVMRYNSHLKNGLRVYGNLALQGTIPPLAFRNGLTWHHDPRDQPILMLEEVFSQNIYEPLEARAADVVLDVGANMGAVTTFWAMGRPDIQFHAYEPNPDSYATLVKNV